MTRRTITLALLAVGLAVAVVASASAAAGEVVRGGGAQLTLPDGWSKVVTRDTRVDDPRTLLVVGTDGVKAIDSDCQVSAYRVPADGAVVVVLGWRDSVGGSSLMPLSGMKLRRGTFDCFAGRGAVGRLTRRDRDFQLNVMVGDRASAATIDAAFDAVKSFGAAPRA
ncbi:MAG TPA: hypothetical protein VHR46_02945 [Gaiella sp.]|nr:hypothetical protein [Gaiella sp.]